MIENAVSISGTVDRKVDVDGQIFVKAFLKHDLSAEYFDQSAVHGDGSFNLTTYPGEILLTAYIDVNGNQKFDADEPAAHLSESGQQTSTLQLSPGQTLKNQRIVITGEPFEFNDYVISNGVSTLRENLGKVVNINDPMFGRDNANMGLWRPMDFVEQVGGGLLLLEDYAPEKTPVLFIHGIGGTPLEFKPAIEALDTSRYQAWVFFYPSGVRLDIVSNYLLSAMEQLHSKYEFDDIALVAHSMGGLMSRSFLMKHQETLSAYNISKHVTINSPIYGMSSANAGVEYSPVVIPVWRDVASDSEFVQRVSAWHMPDAIDYHLFFSYYGDENGDGVVPLNSQLSLSLQQEASKIYGFNAQHAEILRHEKFITELMHILE